MLIIQAVGFRRLDESLLGGKNMLTGIKCPGLPVFFMIIILAALSWAVLIATALAVGSMV